MGVAVDPVVAVVLVPPPVDPVVAVVLVPPPVDPVVAVALVPPPPADPVPSLPAQAVAARANKSGIAISMHPARRMSSPSLLGNRLMAVIFMSLTLRC
jgi:hypothetical protein